MSDALIVEPVKRIAPSRAVVSNDSERTTYWATLTKLWKLPKTIQHFPAANPVSIERNNFQVLKENDFLAALKTDGIRYILLMTVRPGTVEPISIMIDRTMKMYEVEIWASEIYFLKGSLFDGELVWNNKTFETLDFMIFDVICAKGIDCISLPYRDRLQVLHDTIMVPDTKLDAEYIEECLADEDKFISMNNLFNMRIIPKKCVPKSQVKELWESRVFNMHRNDGIIFTKNGGGVQIGTCKDIFKWKPSHSVDVFVRGDLRVFRNNNSKAEFVELTSDHKGRSFKLVKNRFMTAIKNRIPCIVECTLTLDSDTIWLIPERERTDKEAPNTMKVVEATVKNAEELIHIDELHDLLS